MIFAAIPTKYNGVQFRSRLEARWAAFFDLLGWKWEYEPIDLAGYIPDFIVTEMFGKACEFLAEVKPVYQPAFRSAEWRLVDGWDAAIETIQASGWNGTWQVHGVRCGWLLGDREYKRWVEVPAGHEAVTLWREAQNCVQWRGVGARR